MKVCVVGLGYIGLPTAIVLAEHGVSVVGFDVDKEKVAQINNGQAVIKEHELQERLKNVLDLGLFRASSIIESADYFIIAVPTPFLADKKPDLSYVFAANKEVASVLLPDTCVILESTVPVGTTERLAHTLEQMTGLKSGEQIFVAHCPERVLPGKIFYELIYNDRVIGGVDPLSTDRATILYTRFVKGELHKTDAATAELVKLIENSSRDVEIAFAHQVAAMAKKINRDPYQVIALANKHPRVNILRPSCGVGGHCIAVDPWFLIDTFKQETTLLRTARIINDEQPYAVLKDIKNKIKAWRGQSSLPTVLVLGLTYKPDVDDVRESPALTIALELQRSHAKDFILRICEPHVPAAFMSRYFIQEQSVNYEDGIAKADIVVVLVAHSQFKKSWVQRPGIMILDYCGIESHVDNVRESLKFTHKKEGIVVPSSEKLVKERTP